MSAATAPITHAPLWALARALNHFALFGEPSAIAAQHTHRQSERRVLLKWLRADAALMRHPNAQRAAPIRATCVASQQDGAQMPLRHGAGPPPRWLALCAGPFLVFAGLLGAAAIAFDGAITFGDAVGLALALVLAAAGVALTIDTFTGKT